MSFCWVSLEKDGQEERVDEDGGEKVMGDGPALISQSHCPEPRYLALLHYQARESRRYIPPSLCFASRLCSHEGLVLARNVSRRQMINKLAGLGLHDWTRLSDGGPPSSLGPVRPDRTTRGDVGFIIGQVQMPLISALAAAWGR
jgi:hypothetical protein